MNNNLKRDAALDMVRGFQQSCVVTAAAEPDVFTNPRAWPMTRLSNVIIAAAVSAAAVATAVEWPQFHGPRRDNVSDETGLLAQWPAEGPKLLWTATGIGAGFSSAAVAGGLIYITGNVGPDTLISALGPDGKVLWTAKNGPADKHSYPGTRSTVTADGDRVYHENSDGDLVCLEAVTGKSRWSLNILAKFGGQSPKWGLAESPLVDGGRLICVPGGTGTCMVAFDKLTGATLWTCAGLNEKPGYASPVAFDFGGVRQIVTMMEKSVVGVRADTGKLLWRAPHAAFADETVSTPLFHGRHVFVSTLPPGGSQCLELSAEGEGIGVKRAWHSLALNNHHGGVVLWDGHLFGSDFLGKWLCLELGSGRVVYKAEGVGKGALTCAGGMLYTVAEKGGTVGLVKATPQGHAVISRFRLPEGGEGPVWAHPVVCGGRLYLRHGDRLYCYDVKKE
jgi:outer membrane protein assembly factor BamB